MSKPVVVLLSILLALCFSSTVSAAGGVDVEPDLEFSPISNISHSKEVADESTWSISISLEESAANNNTSVRILKQMCTNEGVCYAPEWVDAEPSFDNQTWSTSWVTIDDHAYVNWRVALDYDDGESEEYPPGGYAKAWSSCWYDIDSDEWGGKDCSDGSPNDENGGSSDNDGDCEDWEYWNPDQPVEDCPYDDDDKSSFLPAISMLAAGAMIIAAAVVSRGSK